MITNPPNAEDLAAISTGWHNLAWENVISISFYLVDADEFKKNHVGGGRQPDWDELRQRLLSASRYRLQNTVPLLQQAIEIFLKAKIVEVSPYLLIAGDVQGWPKPDKTGSVDFAAFKTVDAVHLCRVVKTVSSFSITERFQTFFDELRRRRNVIAHLCPAKAQGEVKDLMLDILKAHKFLYPDERWVAFRRKYLKTTKEYCELSGGNEDDTNYRISLEVGTALTMLSPRDCKTFLGIDKKRKRYPCPECVSPDYCSGDVSFFLAQKAEDCFIECPICEKKFSRDKYLLKLGDVWRGDIKEFRL